MHGGDRRHRALQDAVDLLQAAPADHRELAAEPRFQPPQQRGAPGLGAHVLRPRPDGGQGSVQIQEQGDVAEARQGARFGEGCQAIGRHAQVLLEVITLTSCLSSQARVITEMPGSDLRPGTAITRSPACWNSSCASEPPTLRLSMTRRSMPIGRLG